VIDKSGDFFGQRLCVDCVFRQGGIVFCRKLYDVRPSLFDFLDIGGDVADTFISGGAQTRNHDKRYGEQKSHYDDGAQAQTDQSLQPRALPRHSLSQYASSGRRRVFIQKAISPPSRNGKNSVPILPTTLTTLPKFISAHASRISSASEQKTWRRSLRSSRNVFGSAEVSRCSD